MLYKLSVEIILIDRTYASDINSWWLDSYSFYFYTASMPRSFSPPSPLHSPLSQIYATFLESRQVRDIFSDNKKDSKGMNSLRSIGLLQKLCRHPILLLPYAHFTEPLKILYKLSKKVQIDKLLEKYYRWLFNFVHSPTTFLSIIFCSVGIFNFGVIRSLVSLPVSLHHKRRIQIMPSLSL